VSPAPRYGGARAAPSFTFRALPPATAPATLSKGARVPRLLVSHGPPAHLRCAGSPAYADGYYAMSSAPQQPPQSTSFADSVQRAPTLLPPLPPAPLDRGFAASKLHHAEGASDDRQARLCWHTCGAAALTGVSASVQSYLNYVQLVQERRPDAAPQFVAWDTARRASEPTLAGAFAGSACERRRSLRPRRSPQRSAHACCCCLGLRHGEDCGASAT